MYAFAQKYTFCQELNLGRREPLSVWRWWAGRWASQPSLPDPSSGPSSFSQSSFRGRLVIATHYAQILALYHIPTIAHKKQITSTYVAKPSSGAYSEKLCK